MPQSSYHFRDFALDPVNKTLRQGGDDVKLRPRTFDLLFYLVERAGRLATKEELFSALWPDVVVTDDALVHCVGEIRHALGDEAIRTVARRGYVFALDVQAVAPGSNSAPTPRRSRPRTRLLALLGTATLCAVVAVAVIGARRKQADPLSIAVLPFATLNAGPDQEYFAEALVADITTDLARLPRTLVIARNSANTYRGANVDPARVGGELGVRFLVQGSVTRLDDDVRLNLRLTDAARGLEVWAERIDGDRRNLAALQRRVTDSIARTLHVEAMDAEARRATAERPRDPDAHDLEMRGWALWNRQRPETVAEARELLKRAVALDPDRASAWSTLSATYTADLLNRWMHLRGHSREEWIQLHEQAAEKAYALDPRYIGPRCTTFMFRRQHEQALACREKQIELKPPDPLPYHMAALAHQLLGQPEQAIAREEQAIRVSPRDTRLHNFTLTMAAAEYQRGRYREALALAERAVNLNPDFGLSYAYLAGAAVEVGDVARARSVLAEFRRHLPEATVESMRKEMTSDAPAFVAFRERMFDDLRKAGLPD
jgi:TolB-like protein/DNA-binding winged helix-turn-helix (wHTH) protein/Tfp pilus assembly protein PilF